MPSPIQPIFPEPVAELAFLTESALVLMVMYFASNQKWPETHLRELDEILTRMRTMFLTTSDASLPSSSASEMPLSLENEPNTPLPPTLKSYRPPTSPRMLHPRTHPRLRIRIMDFDTDEIEAILAAIRSTLHMYKEKMGHFYHALLAIHLKLNIEMQMRRKLPNE